MTSFTATGVPPSVAIVVSENVNDLLAVQDKGDVGCGTSFVSRKEDKKKLTFAVSQNFKFQILVDCESRSAFVTLDLFCWLYNRYWTRIDRICLLQIMNTLQFFIL